MKATPKRLARAYHEEYTSTGNNGMMSRAITAIFN